MASIEVLYKCHLFIDFIQNMSQVLICEDIEYKLDYLKNPSHFFVLGSFEYLERLEGKIRKCLFFYVKIF